MATQRRTRTRNHAHHHLLLLLLLLLTISIQTLAMSSHKPKAQNLEWITSKPNHNYKGAIEDYLEGEELGLELGSELSRRILATAGTISYGALRRDTTPCSRRGASYYNCRAGAQANPYSRGCSAITQCRS